MKNQRNKYLLLGLVLLSGAGLESQTVEKVFLSTPDLVNPTMTKQNRLELLEYHKAGRGDSIGNRFGNMSVLQVLDTLNNRLVVKDTRSSVFEMKLMRTDKPVIGIINTVCSPICRSVVEFYDTAWNKLPIRFEMPRAISWLDRGKLAQNPNVDIQWVERVLETGFVSLQFDAANQWIVATNHTEEFLGDEDRKVIQPLLKKESLVFRLEGNAWMLK